MSKEPIHYKDAGELKSRLIKIAAQLLGGNWASDVADDYPARVSARKVAHQAERDAEQRRLLVVELRSVYDKMDSVLNEAKADAAREFVTSMGADMCIDMETAKALRGTLNAFIAQHEDAYGAYDKELETYGIIGPFENGYADRIKGINSRLNDDMQSRRDFPNGGGCDGTAYHLQQIKAHLRELQSELEGDL